jgi:hypothetical protein
MGLFNIEKFNLMEDTNKRPIPKENRIEAV